MTETELKTLVVTTARRHGWMVYSATWGQVGRVQRGAKGYPDLTLARAGEVLFFELKQEGSQTRPEQEVWGKAINGKTSVSKWYVIRPSDYASGYVEMLLR